MSTNHSDSEPEHLTKSEKDGILGRSVLTNTEDPYFITVDTNGCGHCGEGRTWAIVGPDGVMGGTSFEDEDEAADLVELLNDAYCQGRSGALSEAQRAKEEFWAEHRCIDPRIVVNAYIDGAAVGNGGNVQARAEAYARDILLEGE